MGRARPRRKVLLIGFLETITGLGLKIGIPVLIAAMAYTLISVFGGSLKSVATMKQEDAHYLLTAINWSCQALMIATAVVVTSFIIRRFYDELVGQMLSLFGAVIYFLGPLLFADMAAPDLLKSPVFIRIVNAYITMGAISLCPGLVLIMRDLIMRIWDNLSRKRLQSKVWAAMYEKGGARKPKLYGCCWDMEYCRDFVKKVCPAAQQKKPCWRIKMGCYCDERTILTALTSTGSDNVHVRGIMESLGVDKSRQSLMSARQKRARCRRCGIYAEHQRQKYRIVSPLVFPAVGLLLMAFNTEIYAKLWVVMSKADKVMSLLTYRPDAMATSSFAADGHILTILAMVWLTIIAISYSLRIVEYAIFELQI